jgi:hypothetical protein
MSDIETQNALQNEQHKEDLKLAEAEHLREIERQRITMESYYDPKVIALKARRKVQAAQLRRWKPGKALPKKRIAFALLK